MKKDPQILVTITVIFLLNLFYVFLLAPVVLADSITIKRSGLAYREIFSGKVSSEESGHDDDPGGIKIGVGADPNTGYSRSGIVTIAGEYFTVSQDYQSCAYELSDSSKNFSSGGGSIDIEVYASSSSCSWEVWGEPEWIELSTISGIGDGSVTVTALPNAGPARSGSVIIAGEYFTVSQDSASFLPSLFLLLLGD
jgi:hypothetical protein